MLPLQITRHISLTLQWWKHVTWSYRASKRQGGLLLQNPEMLVRTTSADYKICRHEQRRNQLACLLYISVKTVYSNLTRILRRPGLPQVLPVYFHYLHLRPTLNLKRYLATLGNIYAPRGHRLDRPETMVLLYSSVGMGTCREYLSRGSREGSAVWDEIG